MRVPALCAYPKDLEEVAAGCTVPRPPAYWAHESRRTLTRIVPPIPGLYNCYAHANCVCNELISATNRVVGKVPLPTHAGLTQLKRAMRKLVRHMPPVDPMTKLEFLAGYAGPRLRRYEAAFESLDVTPLERKDGNVSAFIKAEKTDPSKKVNPDPRMIQLRNARYNVIVGKYMKRIEHHLYTLLSPTNTRMVAKGLNASERGELLEEKLRYFRNPVVYSIDGSRWDKHIDVRILDIEHSFYKILCKDAEFAQALSWQRTNKTRTSGGVKYKSKGKRMSGDMNTALGNCLLMCLMSMTACEQLGLGKWDILDDGDDCLIIVERSEEWRLRGLTRKFLEFGQEIKLENRSTDIHGVEFCQSKIVYIDGKPRFVRNWKKCLSGDTSGVKYWGDPNICQSMFATIGTCSLAMFAGVPIMQEHALACLRIGGKARLRMDLATQDAVAHRYRTELGKDWVQTAQKKATETFVTAEARASFAQSFGLTVEEQFDIEARLKNWHLDSFQPKDFPKERKSDWVDNTHLDNLTTEL